MHLATFIARRYLFAKKSHNVINIISLISAAGVVIGTMALVVVLSVYNGFEDLVKSLYNTFDADLRIAPATGKTFIPQSPEFDAVRRLPGIVSFAEVLEENVLLEYRSHQDIAAIKGIDSAFLSTTRLPDAIVDGEFKPWHGELEQAVIGRAIAYKLGIGVHLIDPLHVYAPSREGRISLVDVEASLVSDYIFPAGIFAIEQSFDNVVFVPLPFVRRLFDYTDEVSAIEIQLAANADAAGVQTQIKKLLGDSFTVKNRYEQHATLHRMMKSEKAAIYAILLFMLIVISCNILGSLAMLIIEKKSDVFVLRSMGANDRLINRIFLLEGWMISVLGVVTGIILGLLVCFTQQWFGIISMPGNFLVSTYPVSIRWTDVTLVGVAVLATGYVMAWLPARIVGSNSRQRKPYIQNIYD
ncbi:MAG: ABC transporter permease [Prevotellaceae bacterium]|nr:ABC transporter permease [Prevotellaceae bacterium]